jgi:hypothetical protein
VRELLLWLSNIVGRALCNRRWLWASCLLGSRLGAWSMRVVLRVLDGDVMLLGACAQHGVATLARECQACGSVARRRRTPQALARSARLARLLASASVRR